MQSPWYRSLSVNFFFYSFCSFLSDSNGKFGESIHWEGWYACVYFILVTFQIAMVWTHSEQNGRTHMFALSIIHMYYVPDLVLIPYYILTIEYIFVPNWVHCRSQWSRIYSSWITTIPIDVTLCDRIIQTSIEFIAITRWDYNHWLLPSI